MYSLSNISYLALILQQDSYFILINIENYNFKNRNFIQMGILGKNKSHCYFVIILKVAVIPKHSQLIILK